ncbi:peroxiredoxin-like family protein [Saccharicrinis aurantiacus]|uniref:peroxiredoxin-like family protein n=1 Tax=Saccharicrinis aurantiacus TaxID=1849719 RepID=UPI0024916E60|nr:peroxiredoxin-like family protein [Saccharicrinis aurantiacus]
MKTLSLIAAILLSINIYSQEKIKAIDAKGIDIGSYINNFKATTDKGELFSLNDALKDGPVVIIFYRGFWCPVCNKHLAAMQDSLHLIADRGAQLIAISPEKPEYLNIMKDKTGAKFTLLHDENYEISDTFGVTFTPSKTTRTIYNIALGAKLKETHSDESEQLPIPATYIINTDGTIIWRHIDPYYKNRANVKDILNNLPVIIDTNPLY